MKKSLFLLPLVAFAMCGCNGEGGKACNHVDANKDHICDLCEKKISAHSDTDFNHECDICGQIVSECQDLNNDHLCETCGKTLSQCQDDDDNGKCDLCGKRLAPIQADLTLDYNILYEAAGSNSTGYAAISSVTSLGEFDIAFDNVCINQMNSASKPDWTTPNDEQVFVVQFKNPANGCGVIKVPNVLVKSVKIYLLTSYNVDNDFKVTFGGSNVTMSADAGTATEYKKGTYPIKEYVLTYNVSDTNAGDLVIQNQGQGARYVSKIVIA